MEMGEFYNNCINSFKQSTRKPEEFLEANPALCSKLEEQLKEIYDFTKNSEIKVVQSSALPELIIKNFETEQIWQQIELQNESLLDRSIVNVSKLVAGKDRLIFANLVDKLEEVTLDEEEVEENEDEDESDESDSDPEINENEEKSDSDLSSNEDSPREDQPVQNTVKKSIVDDDFFKLDEMENFLKAEEKKMNDPDSGNDSESSESESEGSVNLFEGGSEDEEDKAKVAKFKDFFVAQQDVEKKEKRNKFLEEIDESDNENREQPKSSYELRQERLTEKIAEIEQNAITEKPWQLKGEITGENRPQNSLLQEVVEFDMTTRPAPIITEQASMQLDDIIRRRIKDKVFDSVEKKTKLIETPLEYKKKLVIDQERNKQSLAQIYEKEYLDQKAALDPENAEKEDEIPELHKTITTMMDGLFQKLDALSNYHFTPKPAAPELKIISNLPAISMEEVAPVGTSEATLLAPEEVKGKPKGDDIGKAERTVTDKNRERRKKKQKQKVHAIEKLKREEKLKMKPGSSRFINKEKEKKIIDKLTKNKNVNKMEESAKIGKSSKAFFTQLEEEAKAQIKKTGVKRSKTKNDIDAKKLKL